MESYHQLPPYQPAIPENEAVDAHGHPQYEEHQVPSLHIQTQSERGPPSFHEMPVHSPLSPIELPGDFGEIDTRSEGNMNDDSNTTPKIRYSLHAPSSPPPLRTAYGDVAEGNPYADDDTLATPTPTQERNNGMGMDGTGYIGGHYGSSDERQQGQYINSGDGYLNDALLQLRFVDDAGDEGGQNSQSRQAGGGFGTAL